MFQIEKEAYRWSDEGIETLEDAFAYIHKKDQQNTAISRVMKVLQIRGRTLTPPEEKYINEWLQAGITADLIRLAYEKTCEKTGGLNWPYMNKILTSWKQEGYRSPAEVRTRGRKQDIPQGASGQIGEAELEAIHRILTMDTDEFLHQNH